jgi:site-specific recombinase XerD
MSKIPTPLPLFDSLEYITEEKDLAYVTADYHLKDIQKGASFLKSYRGSQGTFNSYRREIERLIHWCVLVEKKKLTELKRESMEAYLSFCQHPPKHWIGTTKPARFVVKEGLRVPNPAWRPFIANISKSKRRKGGEPEVDAFELAHGTMKEIFAILGSFYNYLIQEEYAFMNPVALIRQKSKFLRRTQSQPKIRRLSELQWHYVIKTSEQLADKDPNTHERTLLIMSALYSMYLRISELAANLRWIPKMNDFSRDSDGNWWFTTVGKGNKERQIAVSVAMLEALKRWRKYLGLSALPSSADDSPLLPKTKGQGPIASTNTIRKIVQYAFDQGIYQLSQDGFEEEAELLNEATVHWLRHTGISDDVKTRPREHVRDDAGHSSSAITDRYIDVELKERHRSAQKKLISDE